MLVTDIDSPTGGVQVQSFRLLGELGRRGVRSYVCARNYHGRPRRELRDGVEIRRSPTLGRRFGALNSVLYLADTLGWLVRNRRRYDVIHCQQMFGATMVGLLARRLLGKPVVVRVTSTGELGEVRQIREMAFSRLRLSQIRRVDRWVALTIDMKRELLSLGISETAITVIPNAANLPAGCAFQAEAKDDARRALGLSAEKVAVYTGRLSSEKGLDSLLRAWGDVSAVHADAVLLLVGAGGGYRNVEADLRALCDQLSLGGSVRFVGHVDEVERYLIASDLFVLPSRTEGMSNALVEAMAAGCAVVTTDIPANRAIVVDEISGLLVPVDAEDALASAISRVFRDPDRGNSLGMAARAYAERELSIIVGGARYHREYLRLYDPGHRIDS
jgi:glycosyltransferase involved in cell wall biosynthesis